MTEQLKPQVVSCSNCGKELARGKVTNGGYIKHPSCKKRDCRDAHVFVETGD